MNLKSVLKIRAVTFLLFGAVLFPLSLYAHTVNAFKYSKGLKGTVVQVTGKVTDEKGTALGGASVVVKGTSTGTSTDVDGNFSLSVENPNAILVFSLVGYTSIELPVSDRFMNVVLAEDTKKLDEVVVIGYGTQKKADLTGSVSTVSSEKLNQGVNQSAAHALQGQASGVTVIQNSGEPGSGVEIRIRGAGSINDNSPLYVVDGIIGGIGNLNPADIESMTVLKDAASAAIYGSRGANGVVIVTTKKGRKNQRLQTSFNTSHGMQSPWKMPTSLTAEQRNVIHKEALTNDGTPTTESIWNYYNNPDNAITRTDWFREVLKPAYISNSSLSVQGGGEKSTYLFSLGHLNNNGIVMGTYSKRYNIRFNSVHEIARNLSLGENFSYSESKTKLAELRGGYDGVLSAALFNMRNTPVWADKENNVYGTPTGDFPNPVASLNVRDNKSFANNINGNLYLEYKLLNMITLKSDFGYNSGNFKSKNFRAIAVGGGRGLDKNSLNENYANSKTYIWNNTATFDKFFNKHHITTLVGMSMESGLYEWVDVGTGRDFSDESPALRYYSNAGTFPNHPAGSADDYSLLSYFGRVSYEFMNKYLLAANFRADGSSKFAEAHRWGYFPSVSAGWRISEENFFKDLKDVVSELKLRASWGQLGNDKIPNYQFYSTISTVGSPTLNGNAFTAVAQNRYSNPNIKWEVTTQTDVGIDLGLMDNRLLITADYFDKRTTDILVQVPLVASLGVSNAPFSNAGEVSNKGFDLGINYQNREHAFKYSITANMAKVKNELISFGVSGKKDMFAANYKNFVVGRIAEGEPLGHFYVLHALGIFQSQAEVDNYKNATGAKIQPNAVAGDIKFEDRNNDGQISSDDRFNAGNSFPDFTASLGFNGEYKGFDVSMLWIGSQGNKIFNGLKLGGVFMQGSSYNNSPEILNRWTTSNPSNTVPRVTIKDFNNNKMYNTLYLEDGSFARMKYLTFGYTFKNSLLSEKISKLRVYLTMQNLITLTKYTGYDPEVGSEGGFSNNMYGVDAGTYPMAKAFIFGINFNF